MSNNGNYKHKYEKYKKKYNDAKNKLHNQTKRVLKESIDEFFTPWKSNSKSENDKLLKDMKKFYEKNKSVMGIVKIIIKNGKMSHVDDGHFKNLLFYAKSRWKITQKMIQFFLSMIKNETRNKINLVFYLTVFDWMDNENFPVFGFARSRKKNGILIPDWTWFNSYKTKLKSHWIHQAKIIDMSNKMNYHDKQDVVFFQGVDTSRTKSDIYPATDIRRNLKNVSLNDDKYKILIDDEPKSVVTEWSQYRYLLDLPGGSAWSVRLKELFMARSLTIKIDIEDTWINFYSDLFIPGVDYKQIIIPNPNFNSEEKIETSKRVKREIDSIVDNISEKEYSNMVNSAYIKMKSLDTHVLTFFFECVFNKYMEVFC